MVDSNESKKAEALWQTLPLYSAYSFRFFVDTHSILVLVLQTLFSAPSILCVSLMAL